MAKEDKELLLRDLCARLPYGVMIDYESHIYILNEIDPACKDMDYITCRIQDVERLMCAKSVMIENIKPYLRPMSSMTEDERKYLQKLPFPYDFVDWLNAHHFDYRNLIEKGLALEATTEMYK